jgi:hypothetical protein
MAGDYTDFQKLYTSKTTDLTVLAATTTQADFILPKSANHALYIQKIVVSINVYAAQTMTFTDSAGTPVLLALISVPAAAVALRSESGDITYDFGPTGTKLTTGEGLTLTLSAAGIGARVHVEAYERLVGPVAQASTN